MIDAPERAVAFHESGHAIVASVLGLPITCVTIEPDAQKNWLGHFKSVPPLASSTSDGTWADIQEELAHDRFHHSCIVVSLAGRVAEARFTGVAVDVGFSGDYRLVLYCLRELGVRSGDERVRIVEAARERARALVDEHWREIQEVAEALLKRETLTGREVMEVINCARSCERFRG